MKFIRWFDQVSLDDVPLVGGKNASLGQMITSLRKEGISVPYGFAITADAYWYYLKSNTLVEPIKDILAQLKPDNIEQLQTVGKKIRSIIVDGTIPQDLADEITRAYEQLCKEYKQKDLAVAVRSSATAEDLPEASFAGQQDTFLNIKGDTALLASCKKSFASLFTDRAIVYRSQKGFDHMDVALSIGIQKMVHAGDASAGVAFSLDTESGFKDVVMIESSWGLGESIVKGLVIPDEFLLFTPLLKKGYTPIINKKCGVKRYKYVASKTADEIEKVVVPPEQQNKFSLNEAEIIELAKAVVAIEHAYTKKHKRWTPVDVEWAKDGGDKKLYILQARPETIHSLVPEKHKLEEYRLLPETQVEILAQGISIGHKITSGRAVVIDSVEHINQVEPGDIIVTTMSDPDWVPALKKSGGIITQEGGRTCHAAIVSRELGITALVGVEHAMTNIQTGQMITIDCAQGTHGYVYEGEIPFEVITTTLKELPKLPVALMVNLGDPAGAFKTSMLPVDGVGLARIEFIISNSIKIHPMVAIHPEKIEDTTTKDIIKKLCAPFGSCKEYVIAQLAYGVGTIAAAFYPRPVIVRFSDFKTNEYANLVGGEYFEMHEQNPMLGFRGAARYYNPRYQEAFALECAAIKRVRQDMGLDNVAVMIPFVRTTKEAQRVLEVLKANGLQKGKHSLQVIMMAELPANVLLVDEFSAFFDGFSIGSNDLTQLTLGIDRDSPIMLEQFDEHNPAVKKLFKMLIEGAKRNKRSSGICGQAPSDFPDVARFLIDCGIDSISLNADAVLPFLLSWKG